MNLKYIDTSNSSFYLINKLDDFFYIFYNYCFPIGINKGKIILSFLSWDIGYINNRPSGLKIERK